MNDFIFVCIGAGLPFVGAIFLLGIYFTLKNNLTDTGRKSCLTWAIFLVVGSAILAGTAFSSFSQCPNPKCNEWVKSDYCPQCGQEVNSSIDCPTCEKEFDSGEIPAFCPDCGTEIICEKPTCTKCGERINTGDRFCSGCVESIDYEKETE